VRDNPVMNEESDRQPQGGEPDSGAHPPQPPQPPPPPQPPQPQFNQQTGYPAGPQYGQSPYPPGPPGWAPHPGYALPDNPKATAALVTGIVAVAGGMMCAGVPLLASPVAWIIGAQARGEIRRSPQHWGGESKATTGMVLGIIGTVLLLLGLIVVAIIIAIAISNPDAFDDNTSV
jgi:hypothetical protein